MAVEWTGNIKTPSSNLGECSLMMPGQTLKRAALLAPKMISVPPICAESCKMLHVSFPWEQQAPLLGTFGSDAWTCEN